MSFHYSPKIVTDGLVLYLDAANTKSYVGSGVTIRDLLGISSAGTLINGPTYSSAFGGYLNYDGANDYNTISNLNPLNLTFIVTFSMWCRMNDPLLLSRRASPLAAGPGPLSHGDIS
jgi:hypothetical protein